MNIEFNTTVGEVTENQLIQIRKQLLELAHLNKNINRAEVMLKEDTHILSEENKICEISLLINGEHYITHKRSGTFEKSVKEVIKDLKKKVEKLMERKSEANV